MIHVNFVAPNYLYEYRSVRFEPLEEQRNEIALAFARNEGELRQQIATLRRTANKIEAYDFSEWRRRAEKATEATVLSFRQGGVEFQPLIWSSLKPYLFSLFGGKCAYCEAKVLVVSSGDVEHYRPKKKVDGESNHPGYYWLAYDVSNLLPCCEKCNRCRGKRNQFPVEGLRCFDPGDQSLLDSERPLLLNPYVDHDIENHLGFWTCEQRGDANLLAGTICGRTEKGRTSVRVYNLDRDELNDARRDAQFGAVDALKLAFARGEGRFEELLRSICLHPEREFSAAVRCYVRAWWNCTVQRVEGLTSEETLRSEQSPGSVDATQNGDSEVQRIEGSSSEATLRSELSAGSVDATRTGDSETAAIRPGQR
jgi:hypothetical protein